MDNNQDAKYCLKGQSDILVTHRVVSALEEKGIEVYTDEYGERLVCRRAFAELCRMYEYQGMIARGTQNAHEKKIKRLKVAIIVLAVICSVTSALCVSLYADNKDLFADQTYLMNELSDIEKELSDVEGDYRKKVSELRDLKADYNEISDEYAFWHENAVIVTTTGEKYHTYDCYHIEDRRYWIYNIELAKYKGYTACLDCIEW